MNKAAYFKKLYKVKRGLRKLKYKNPLFTIITVVFNGVKYIKETIDSIAKQKIKNYEYIVIDGNSTDNTINIINKNLSKIDFWLSENDKGLYDAFNKGMKLASGEFICIVNSDDKLTKNALQIIKKYILKFPDIDFIFGSVKKHWGILHGYRPHKIKYSWGFYSSHSTGFYLRRSSSKIIGKYNLKYKYHADYDFFYRMIVEKGMKGMATKKKEVTGIFRRGGFSSKIHFRKLFFEEIKIRYDNNQSFVLLMIIVVYKFIFNFKKIIF